MSAYLAPPKIRVMIVDDEPAPRELMQRYVSAHSELDLIAIASHFEEAQELLHRHAVDLLFLDVDLGHRNSFELLSTFETHPFKIIFCTSHSQYALQAFHVSAIDYLLKPFSEADFGNAILKYKKQTTQLHHEQHALQNLLDNFKRASTQQKVALPSSNGLLFVKFSEIVHIESQNTLTIFYLTDRQQIVVSRTMKECEDMLRDFGFCRVHQSHLINLQFVKKYVKGEGGQVIMEDGSTIEVSRRKKEEFLSALQKI
jgi:two-component system, LytTR family, response regulator